MVPEDVQSVKPFVLQRVFARLEISASEQRVPLAMLYATPRATVSNSDSKKPPSCRFFFVL